MQYPLGAKLSKKDPRNIMFASVMPPIPEVLATLPKVFSRRLQQSPVVAQFYGSCTGYTAKDLKEAMANREGNPVQLSGRGAYILFKQADGDPQQGTDPLNMMKIMRGIGVPREADILDEDPGTYDGFITGLSEEAIQNADSYRISGYAQLASIEDIRQALIKFAEVPITIAVYEDYLTTDAHGVIQQPTGKFVGWHEVLVIGYDETKQLLEIKNHWGTGWGDNGFGFLPYWYSGYLCFVEAFSTVDFIASTTKGAPVNLAYPVDNPFITQPFGARPDFYKKYGLAGHEGDDFRAIVGSNVYAVDDGEVILAALSGALGNCIKIQHAWGLSEYGHLINFVVKSGQVKKGQLIGHSGGKPGDPGAGDSDAPHLHCGIKINGVSNPPFKDWVDPAPYFRKGTRMLVYFQVKGNPTIWRLVDGEWYGFGSLARFTADVDSRQYTLIQLDQTEFNKLKTNSVVF